MPVRNAVSTVTRAVQSIEAQSCKNWELIVVDDGSTDGTWTVLTGLAARNKRIRLCGRDFAGMAPALNAGLKHCRCKYVARMDADDASLPERLSLQHAFLEQHAEVGMVATRVAYGGDRAQQGGYSRYVNWSNALVDEEAIALNRFVESPFVHPSVMFRRSLIDTLGAYSTKNEPEDYELWLRWYAHGVRMLKLEQVLYLWNDPPQRLSRVSAHYSTEAFARCKAPYLARWLRQTQANQRALYVWGAGRVTRKRVKWLIESGLEIQGYVDVAAKKIGQTIGGARVIAPIELPPPGDVFVLSYVGSWGAGSKVKGFLVNQLGYMEGVDFLMVA